MKDKIGFIAVGQAGGNIGQLLEKKGFPVLYVNTSQEDLDTIKEGKFKHHIANGEGCNKDRNKAKQLVVADFNNIIEKIQSTIKTDMLFTIFSAGGGTGSGAGPMLTDMLLMNGTMNVGVITILPALHESIKTQINAYECFSELIKIEGIGSTFIIDNDKGSDKLNLNATFVSAFYAYTQIPKLYHSKKGNVDVAEVLESFKAHGMATIKQFNNTAIEELVDIDKNIFAPLQHDKIIKYLVCAALKKL